MNMFQYPVTPVLLWYQKYFPSIFYALSVIYGPHKIAGPQNIREVLQNQP